jgi:hypothetical protein
MVGFMVSVVPLIVTTVWFVSLLDKRISMVEQNQVYMADQMKELKNQLSRIGDNSEKIYRILASKGIVHDRID